jgi:hypothetical protein
MFSFLCVNDNKDVDIDNPKIMCYIYVLCYDNSINAFNLIIKARKGLISYYKTNGVTTFNFFEKEVNSPLRKIVGEKKG